MPPTVGLRERVEDALLRDEPIELEDLILEFSLHTEEREWAECCCAQLAKHRNAVVRGNALAGLGHLARRFGRLDRNRVKRLIETGLHARHNYVRERAESAATDIETFLDWQLERPPEPPVS